MSPSKTSERTCELDGCSGFYWARGMCRSHYSSWYERTHPRSRAEYSREYKKRNREKVLAWKRKSSATYRAKNPEHHRRYALPSKYGITQADFDALLEAQGGMCALCSHPDAVGSRLDIDHDAKTGRVRGLLCRRHNMGLGYFQDSPELLRQAARYLERGD